MDYRAAIAVNSAEQYVVRHMELHVAPEGLSVAYPNPYCFNSIEIKPPGTF